MRVRISSRLCGRHHFVYHRQLRAVDDRIFGRQRICRQDRCGMFHMDGLTAFIPTWIRFFSAVDGHTPLNVASLTGHCSARASGTGYCNRPYAGRAGRNACAAEKNLQQGACVYPRAHVRTRPLRAEGRTARGRRTLRTLQPPADRAPARLLRRIHGVPELLAGRICCARWTSWKRLPGAERKTAILPRDLCRPSSFKCKGRACWIIARMGQTLWTRCSISMPKSRRVGHHRCHADLVSALSAADKRSYQ